MVDEPKDPSQSDEPTDKIPQEEITSMWDALDEARYKAMDFDWEEVKQEYIVYLLEKWKYLGIINTGDNQSGNLSNEQIKQHSEVTDITGQGSGVRVITLDNGWKIYFDNFRQHMQTTVPDIIQGSTRGPYIDTVNILAEFAKELGWHEVSIESYYGFGKTVALAALTLQEVKVMNVSPTETVQRYVEKLKQQQAARQAAMKSQP